MACRTQVCALRARLSTARRVVVLGNGGIALELVHALKALPRAEVVWAVRDGYIGNTFFDASASAFAMPELDIRRAHERSAKRHKGMSSGPTDAAEHAPIASALCECSPETGLNVASTVMAAANKLGNDADGGEVKASARGEGGDGAKPAKKKLERGGRLAKSSQHERNRLKKKRRREQAG